MKRFIFILTFAFIGCFSYSALANDVVIVPRHPKKGKVVKKHHRCKHPHCKVVRPHRH